jgi:hypothetical protein
MKRADLAVVLTRWTGELSLARAFYVLNDATRRRNRREAALAATELAVICAAHGLDPARRLSAGFASVADTLPFTDFPEALSRIGAILKIEIEPVSDRPTTVA